MWLTLTVFLMRWEGPGYSELEYNSVRKSELMRVDLPRPDSPEKERKKSSCLDHHSYRDMFASNSS